MSSGQTNVLEQLMREMEQQQSSGTTHSQNEATNGSTSASRDTESQGPDHRKKGAKFEDFLKSRKHGRRRKKKLTISDVKAETAKILEEFLQAQLLNQDIQTSPSKYQRFVEVDVTETTTPNGDTSDSHTGKSKYLREESIPFADESDHELRKAESLPHDHDIFQQGNGNNHSPSNHNKPSIIHEKSKSSPYPQIEEVARPKRPKVTRPTPPAPPGTPHTASESSNEGVDKAVPYTGIKDLSTHVGIIMGTIEEQDRQTSGFHDKNIPTPYSSGNHSNEIPPRAPDSLPLPDHQRGHRHTGSGSTPNSSQSGGGVSVVIHSSASQSTEDNQLSGYSTASTSTDSENLRQQKYFRKRKKKSVFKKAQERLSTFLRIRKPHADVEMADHESGHSNHSVDDRSVDSRNKKSGKHQREEAMEVDQSDNVGGTKSKGNVLEERKVSTRRHIHQTHTGDGRTVIRTEDSTEIVDIVNGDHTQHTEIHSKVKQSSEGGFMNKVRGWRSGKKRKKKSVSGSKSTQFNQIGYGNVDPYKVDYQRGVSVPGHEHRAYDHTDNVAHEHNLRISSRGFDFTDVQSSSHDANTSNVQVTQAVSKDSDVRRNSSHLDIIDHDGQMIERLYFNNEDLGSDLPRNKSFDFEVETYLRERRIREGDGTRVVRDRDRHDHMEIAVDEDDIYEDGPGPEIGEGAEMEEGATGGEGASAPERQFSDFTETEKEDVYGKIAGRLAAIGDNLMTEREQDVNSRSGSSSNKLSPDEQRPCINPDEMITPESLTPLELEIRDELRRFADELDEKLARDACKAAMHITGMITYNRFKTIVHESVSNEVGWNQVAAVFQLTKKAVQAAGVGGALAVHIKEMSLKYLEDRFATWIVGQGGWDSMLSDDESETDSELD